jgi:hypothetical protein
MDEIERAVTWAKGLTIRPWADTIRNNLDGPYAPATYGALLKRMLNVAQGMKEIGEEWTRSVPVLGHLDALSEVERAVALAKGDVLREWAVTVQDVAKATHSSSDRGLLRHMMLVVAEGIEKVSKEWLDSVPLPPNRN